MTVLSTATVELVADGSRLPSSISQEVQRSAPAAERAGRDTGRRIGAGVSAGAQTALRGVSQALAGGLQGSFQRISASVRQSVDPVVHSVGRFRDGFRSAEAAASVFSGKMGSLGGVARQATDSISSTLRSLRSRLSETWEETERGESVFSRLGDTVKGVFAGFAGFALAETALSAVDEFFRGSVQAFGDFEAGMQAAFTLLPGISQKAMDQMTDQVKVFAKEANTLPEEVVPALYSALGAGVPQETVFDFLETSNKAAIAGVTDLQTSVDALTSVVNTYGSDVISAVEVSDQVFTLMRLGKTTFDEVAASISNVAPVASDFGVAFGDVAASMATLTALGTPTSESTTQIRAAISELGQAGTEASKIFEETAGTTFPKFIREGGNFEEALQVMSKAADESGKSVLDLFGSIEAGSAVASLTGRAGSKMFANAMGEMSDAAGATEAAFETMNRGVNISMKRFQVAVSSAAIELGASLSGVASGAIDVATSAVERFPDMLDRVGRVMSESGAADALQDLFSGLLGIITSLRPVLSGFIDGLGYVGSTAANLLGYLSPVGSVLESMAGWLRNNSQVLHALGVVMGVVAGRLVLMRAATLAQAAASRAGAAAAALFSKGIRGVGVAIRGVPLIGWVLTAIGALVALYQTSDRFREVVQKAFDRVRGAVSSAWERIEPIWDRMVQALSDLWSSVSGWGGWKRAWEGIRDAVSTAWDVISGVWDSLTQGWSDLVSFGDDIGWWDSLWESMSDAVDTSWSIIRTVWDQMRSGWELLTGLFSSDTSLRDVFDYFADSIGRLRDVGELIGTFLVGELRRLPGRVGPLLRALGSAILDVFRSLPGKISDLMTGSEGGGGVLGWVSDTVGQVPSKMAALGEAILGWFRSLPKRVSSAMSGEDGSGGILGWVSDVSRKVPSRLVAFGKAVVAWLTSDLPRYVSTAMRGSGDGGFLGWVTETAKEIPEKMRSFAEGIVTWLTNDLPEWIESNIDPGAIVEWLKDVPSRISEFMQDYGFEILKGFGIAIAVVVLGIPTLLLGLLTAILIVLGTIAVELTAWAAEAFTAMMVRAGQAISERLSDIVTWFQELPDRVLESITGFGERLALWGSSALLSLREAFSSGLGSLTSLWSTAWQTLRSSSATAWTEIVSWATSQAGLLLERVMSPINTLKVRMVQAFESARDGIGRAWNGLKKKIADPINWVIGTGYGGIKNVWDKVVTKFGGDKLPDAPPKIAFATGGIFPGYTPGRDVHAMPMAAFSGGESVLRPEVTRAWGAQTTHMLNRLARTGGVGAVRRALQMLFSGQNPFTGKSTTPTAGSPGGGFVARFARGGVISGAAGRAWDWLSSAADDFADGMMDFLDDPSGMIKKMVNGLVDWDSVPGSGSAWSKLMVKIPKKILDDLAKKAKDLFSIDAEGDWINIGGNVGGRLGAALKFARAQAGKPYIWGGAGPRGYDCTGFLGSIMNVILGKSPYSRRFSTHSFVGSSANGFRRNFPSPFTIGVTHAGVGHAAGTLLKTNVESRGSAGVVVGPRARGTTNSLFSSRWGMSGIGSRSNAPLGGEGLLYDRGGWLMPGMSLVSNHTGKPESVRTYAQEQNVARLVKLTEPVIKTMASADTRQMDRSDAAELRRLIGEGAGAGTVVNAPVTVNTVSQDPQQVAYKTAARIAQMAGI